MDWDKIFANNATNKSLISKIHLCLTGFCYGKADGKTQVKKKKNSGYLFNGQFLERKESRDRNGGQLVSTQHLSIFIFKSIHEFMNQFSILAF